MNKNETKEKPLIQQRITQLLSFEDAIPLYEDQLLEQIELTPEEKENFYEILDQMVETGQLVKTKKKKFALPETLGFLTGRLQGNAKGFGFFIPDNREQEDVFLSAENLHGALHNDRIMIRINKNDGRSRDGEVVRVLERANKTIVGTFEKEQNFGFVVPDDKRINQDVFIPKDELNGAKNGYKVVVEVIKWPSQRRNPEGKVIEVLGHKDDVGTDIVSIIRQFELPEAFPEEVIQAAKDIPQIISEKEISNRRDLRDRRVIILDGADAKDLDDAISIERKSNGNFLLGVHISDVSYYVERKGIIDKEAYERANSVYLVDRVIPMLPKELSNGICSLNPNEDRLAFSVFMEINDEGKVVNHDIVESVIQSKERMVYE
ncbi:MAG: RNB domain-containing ribonuclease, partial [Clostridiales bacterium]|nr:RNB domain-containing ribonuclease [Clostridiales bacterium]